MLSTAVLSTLTKKDYFLSHYLINDHEVILNPEILYELWSDKKSSFPCIKISCAETVEGKFPTSLWISLPNGSGQCGPICDYDLHLLPNKDKWHTIIDELKYIIDYVGKENNKKCEQIHRWLQKDLHTVQVHNKINGTFVNKAGTSYIETYYKTREI